MVQFVNLESVEDGNHYFGDHSINYVLPQERPLGPKSSVGIQFSSPIAEQRVSVQLLATLLSAYP